MTFVLLLIWSCILAFFLLYELLAVLGLCCCAGFSLVVASLLSSCGTQPSHCSGFFSWRARSLGHKSFSSCGSQALEHKLNSCGMLCFSCSAAYGILVYRPEIKPVSLELAGEFFTIEPPGKPPILAFWDCLKRSFLLQDANLLHFICFIYLFIYICI